VVERLAAAAAAAAVLLATAAVPVAHRPTRCVSHYPSIPQLLLLLPSKVGFLVPSAPCSRTTAAACCKSPHPLPESVAGRFKASLKPGSMVLLRGMQQGRNHHHSTQQDAVKEQSTVLSASPSPSYMVSAMKCFTHMQKSSFTTWLPFLQCLASMPQPLTAPKHDRLTPHPGNRRVIVLD